MQYTPKQAAFVLTEARRVLALNEPDDAKVRHLWHSMVILRAHILAQTMQHYLGDRVNAGPFRGMQLTPEVMQGPFAPTLLGVYEHELHPVMERLIAQPFDVILNIGCSYGYYAVGLALRMPQAQIHAFDIDEKAQAKCRDMAGLNKVQSRVNVSGLFHGEDFAAYAGKRTLALVDIEGAELQLLDPAQYPALQKMTILVELHDLFDASISATIQKRFAATHSIEMIANKTIVADIQQGGGYVDPFDKLILTWEDRAGPTPWALMLPKSH